MSKHTPQRALTVALLADRPDGSLSQGGRRQAEEVAKEAKGTASEMLAALVDVEKYWDLCDIDVPRGLRSQVRAAIAKAEGQ